MKLEKIKRAIFRVFANNISDIKKEKLIFVIQELQTELKETNAWVGVEEGLPENRETVLVTDGDLILPCYYREAIGDFVSDYHLISFVVEELHEDLMGLDMKVAKKWQPLPKQ